MNTSLELSDIDPPTQKITDFIEIGCHILMFIIGIPLNLRSLHKQFKDYNGPTLNLHKADKVKQQFLLQKLNLNAANLLSLCVYCPTQIAWFATYQWLAGDFMCKLILFLMAFTLTVCSNVLVVIALERLKNVLALDRLKRADSNHSRFLTSAGDKQLKV